MSRLADIRDWAQEYPGFDGLVKLNAMVTAEGASGINATGSEAVTASYIDGTDERRAEVQIHVAVPWSAGNDPTNDAAAELVEGWADWVAAQWPENPPEIEGVEVTGLEPVYTMPQVETVSEGKRCAVYVLAVSVSFRTRRSESQ